MVVSYLHICYLALTLVADDVLVLKFEIVAMLHY
jgi:hypothetical protein